MAVEGTIFSEWCNNCFPSYLSGLIFWQALTWVTLLAYLPACLLLVVVGTTYYALRLPAYINILSNFSFSLLSLGRRKLYVITYNRWGVPMSNLGGEDRLFLSAIFRRA